MSKGSIHARLRSDLKTYLERAHRSPKHRESARQQLTQIYRQSRRGAHDAWSLLSALAKDDDVNAAALKGAFRDHLVALQSNRCCFCRRWLVNTAYARPIEHILPKAVYAQFSFHFWNLAVACTDCNSKKSDTNWSTLDKKSLRYPSPEAVTDWFHPRFHDYDKHVRYLRLESNGLAVVVFVGITAQGRALCKSLLRHIAAKEMLIGNNPTLSACVNTLNEAGDRLAPHAAEKLMEFQDALGAAVVSKISS